MGLFFVSTISAQAAEKINLSKSTYWKNYFSKEESLAVKKNAEKYVISEIKKKSDDWKGIFTSFNIKKGSINDKAVKDGGLGTDKIRGLDDYVNEKISKSSTAQDFSANNLTGAYAALNGSQITDLTANQVGAIPYSGATGQVDLNGKNLVNVSSLGIGTTSSMSKLDVTGDISLNKVNIFQNHQIYSMGDSLSNNTYETSLETLLGTSWNVNSYGVGGNTTTQMLARFSSDVVVADAEYVVVLGGINDVLASISAATIESNLQAMYTAAHNNGSKVVAVTITPFKTHTSWTSGFQTVVDTVNTWIMNTATDVDYKIDAYSALENPSVPDTLLASYDGTVANSPEKLKPRIIAKTPIFTV
ncbi:MAG: Lipolytic protein G-D-S-L family [Candidatus Moranbacteria bacterium GW2011_GWD2_36_12]|nr:MAG: Lipolytic protein G-D-S-L family [Candidatus Moranbacteria bacterium GW2011_GWD2_36_12]KKQ05400.1 MAG: Lipolytic protein G-D-S-L family [Candidatus Moranbacteria bacterium GW2011_GWE2_36_40]